MERCSRCSGRGEISCSSCGSSGRRTCTSCNGHLQLLWFQKLVISWRNNRAEHVVEKTSLPPEMVAHASGSIGFEDLQQQVIPLQRFPEPEINSASQRLLGGHKFPDRRILMQRHKIRIIAVTKCICKYKNKDMTYYVFGLDNDVHAPDYPQQSCFGFINCPKFMEVNAISTEDQTTKRLSFPSSVEDREDADDFVTIPVESLVNSSNNGEVRIVFLVYKSLSEFMSPPKEEDTGAENDMDDEDETANNDTQPFIGTNIFSTSVNGRKTKFALSKPLTFTLKHKQAPQPGFHAVCSYWQFNESLSGQWSDDGCSLVKTNNSHTTCQCDHMTNFAILMDTVGTKLSLEHQITLTAITYLGCIVSITCLLCCIFTFCFFKNLQCDRNTIHKNLCLSLMMAEIVFLVGINLTQYKIVCGIVAGLLHFWFLAAFSWMCLEGVQLYVMLIEVFEAERSRRLWYYLFGYVCEKIMVKNVIILVKQILKSGFTILVTLFILHLIWNSRADTETVNKRDMRKPISIAETETTTFESVTTTEDTFTTEKTTVKVTYTKYQSFKYIHLPLKICELDGGQFDPFY
ncbi:ADGRL1 [Mytilus edulis]|uniref:ADGRL1 n=1 Tax=Mytilus edulis TaxID=6550 RepID=A0A8S3SC27_MYTED|nr:ADGRL1 [Mytilus edulis]